MAALVAPENTKRPVLLSMKETGSMLAVVARNPAALTRPVAPMTVPLGLRSQTWPFALIVPSIWNAADPLLRLSVIDWLSGWTKFKVSPACKRMRDQSSTARRVVCVTVKVPLFPLLAEPLANVALPCATVNGTSSALAAASAGRPTANASVARYDSRRIAGRHVRQLLADRIFALVMTSSFKTAKLR